MVSVISISTQGIDVSVNGAYVEYLCDTADDIASLPTAGGSSGVRPGSLALCMADADDKKALYILTSNREWVFLREVA